MGLSQTTMAVDEVDARLQAFLKGRDSRILFTRIGPGEYLFGHLSVEVSIGQDGTPHVTLNNLTLPIFDFLKTHEQKEYDYLEAQRQNHVQMLVEVEKSHQGQGAASSVCNHVKKISGGSI